jgi:acyl dehydratase
MEARITVTDTKTQADAAPGLFDDLPIGVPSRTQGRTIGEGDFSALCNLTWTIGDLHSNKELMKGRMGDRIPHAPRERVLALPVVASLMVGMTAKHWISYYLPAVLKVNVLQSLGLEAEAQAPVCPDDTIWVDVTIAKATPDESHPGRGVLHLEEKAVNQRGEAVATVRQRLVYDRTVPPERIPFNRP